MDFSFRRISLSSCSAILRDVVGEMDSCGGGLGRG